MTWKITFYSARVRDETLALPAGIQAIPKNDLDVARRRMKEILGDG